MKRQRVVKIEAYVEPLPKEILGEIAKHYQAKTMADIFRFLSLCKSARDFMDLFISGWIDSICAGRDNYHIKLTESRLNISWRDRTDLRQYWKTEKNREGGPRKEFLFNFFELVKDACCDEHYLKSASRGRQYLCRQYKHNMKTIVGDLFYFDQKNDRVLPLKRVDGLKILEINPKMKVSEELSRLINKNTLPSIYKMCLVKMKKMNESELKSLYQEIKHDLGEPIKIHKPHKSNLVSNAMIGEHHLFSIDERARHIRENLYQCLPEANEKDRMDIVYKYVTRSERMATLRVGLGQKPEEKKNERRIYQVVLEDRFLF